MTRYGWLLGAVFTIIPGIVQGCTILVLGDSISAAYGMPVDKGWVALLEARISRQSRTCSVINASISGETSSGGRRRIESELQQHAPSVVILELGANDGLRGLPPKQMKSNLDAIIKETRDTGAEVILLGIRIPPNYGRQYTQRFSQVYFQLADETPVAFVPLLLADIGDNPELMQNDGLHPNQEAQPLLLEKIWEPLHQLLAAVPGQG